MRWRRDSTSAPPVSARAMTSATSVNSAAPKPRVARAGVPMRSPEVTRGGRGSFGTALRFTVMPTWRGDGPRPAGRRARCRRGPRAPRCTSVPPEMHLHAGRLGVLLLEALGEELRALQGAGLAVGELLGGRHLEGDGLRSDHVHQRAALLAGEDRGIDLLGPLLQCTGSCRSGGLRWSCGSWSRRRRAYGTRLDARHGDEETREVRHVDPQGRANLVGDHTERREVELTGVRGPARDDHLRLLRDWPARAPCPCRSARCPPRSHRRRSRRDGRRS